MSDGYAFHGGHSCKVADEEWRKWMDRAEKAEARVAQLEQLFRAPVNYNGPGVKPRHGYSSTRIYRRWCSIRARCNDPGNTSYGRYGARGIKMCERWDRFENFISDMGEPPAPNMQLDRIDNDGNYEPSNCRWVTMKQNSANRGGKFKRKHTAVLSHSEED